MDMSAAPYGIVPPVIAVIHWNAGSI
jgi:hypothetical protein